MSWIAVGSAAISTVGQVGGALLSKQKAPKATPFVPVDVQAEQRKAMQGNLTNADSIEALTARTNRFTQGEANSLMETAMPGYARLSESLMQRATESADNPYAIPKEVADNIQRLAAERGIKTGVRGQAGEFSALRDFGINSLEYGNSRINQAQGIMQTIASMAPRVNPMSPMAFYITPSDQANMQAANNAGAQNTAQANSNARAAASNANAAMWGQVISSTGGTVAGMVGGMGNTGGTTGTAGRTVGGGSFVPQSGTYYAPGSRPVYSGPRLGGP
jgi:hypothetical protein